MRRGKGHGRGAIRDRVYDDERPLSAVDREDEGEEGGNGESRMKWCFNAERL